jgi:hypothetical protein
MVTACPLLHHINLLFALLQRLVTQWTGRGQPPAAVVRVLMQAESALAAEIRTALLGDGVAFPELDDPAFLAWFARAYPVSPCATFPGSGAARDRGRLPRRVTMDPGHAAAPRSRKWDGLHRRPSAAHPTRAPPLRAFRGDRNLGKNRHGPAMRGRKRYAASPAKRLAAFSGPISWNSAAISGPWSWPVSAWRSGMNSALPLAPVFSFTASVKPFQLSGP